jgi:hypothetical protein
MFLGIPPDYRNDLDIANAVSTFGQYQFWNNEDPIKDRVLVYANFPSPQLVPRDVVFGRFASVGGAKESWTAPVYILTAEFADALPADEDPMPPDGNPHPLPGNLMHNDNLLVQPQYPEIGWDAVPFVAHAEQQAGDGGNADDMNHDNPMEEEEQVSMVLHPSDSSDSSANMPLPDLNLLAQQQHFADAHHVDVLQVGRVTTLFGPVLPPDMLWRRLFQNIMPAFSNVKIPVSLNISAFNMVKRPWSVAFEFQSKDGHVLSSAVKVKEVLIPRRRKVARSLCFDGSDDTLNAPVFSATPASDAKVKQRRRRKQVVQSTERRFTRSCLNKEGYRPTPVVDSKARPKKRPRAKLWLVDQDSEKSTE